MFERYPEYEYLLASGQLAFAMLGMGALLAPRDFVDVFRRPKALGLGLAIQLVTVPLVALVLGRVLPVPPGIAAGLALVAAVPGGSMPRSVLRSPHVTAPTRRVRGRACRRGTRANGKAPWIPNRGR